MDLRRKGRMFVGGYCEGRLPSRSIRDLTARLQYCINDEWGRRNVLRLYMPCRRRNASSVVLWLRDISSRVINKFRDCDSKYLYLVWILAKKIDKLPPIGQKHKLLTLTDNIFVSLKSLDEKI